MKMDGIIPLGLQTAINEMIASLGSGFTVKGVVTKENLPSTGELGDLQLVSDEGYASYVWDDNLNEYVKKVNDVATSAELQEALYT